MTLRFAETHQAVWDFAVDQVRADGRPWYLAGGTGLAIHLDHRDSEDLDLFLGDHFDADLLAEALDATGRFAVSDTDDDTVNGFVDMTKIQFLGVPRQRQLAPTVEHHGLRVAAPVDIMAMKMHAVHGRAKLRDYFDIMELDRSGLVTAEDGVAAYVARYAPRNPDVAVAQIIMALGYLDDVDADPLVTTTFDEIKAFWTARAHELAANLNAIPIHR